MKFLVETRDPNKKYLFLEISDPEVEHGIKYLVSTGDRQKARSIALSNGQLIGIFNGWEIARTKAELIISLNNLHRDLT